MIKYLALLLFLMVTTVSIGQSKYQDVVYLKNGGIIRGTIIEQVPNKSIKIETVDKSVFVYQMDEIEKFTKEQLNVESSGLRNNSEKRKGFIGLSLGASIPVGVYGEWFANTGLQINLINYGYLFSENFGISAMWFGAAHPSISVGFEPWSYGGIMAGPLLSFPLSDILEWDFRPMIGYAVTTFPVNPNIVISANNQASSFAWNLGTNLRVNVGKKVSLLFSVDYFSTKPEFKDFIFKPTIGTISLGSGVAYRLK